MTLDALPPHQGGAEQLARLLAQALLTGHWQPGATFPRELDISKHFAVSRNQVRNALTSLSAAGLLERTAGRGTLVREMGDWHLLDPLMSEWMTGLVNLDPQLVRAIYAFRFSAEPVVAGLAAQAAEAEDLERLERAFAGMENTAGSVDARDEHAEYDVAFHDATYRASHNLVWRQMGHLLRPSIMALIHGSQHRTDTLDDSLARHRQVLDAIRHRDASAAETAAREVLRRTAIDLGIVS
ncbi:MULTISPECIES: FadR/GntR family transcriptional regulator [unclassified Halomonas]|uniref:FadR/GntR family transcriptional regulator n=1 Tax=Halomonadaceae TaxID=28256 RepID=UPI00022D28BF|nr:MULTISPECIES: FCD domain-containing protein [unclassified Halomonas]EHA16608.1 GntR family transcriptional regulator [Halomonas sp. HAL1]PKG54983.1 FadR family transcriptional regulator [Halomonas sp. MES3-P3E]WKV91548.1 FCD domain-containing protein [Halomonas sp. HAL1]|tara:strand:- start:127 stop:846 length:720 start_codon:yes stop_codon:yes gene_type:complete